MTNDSPVSAFALIGLLPVLVLVATLLALIVYAAIQIAKPWND